MTLPKVHFVRQRHGPFMAGLLAGLLAAPLSLACMPQNAIQICGLTFFFVYLVTMALRLPHLDAGYLKEHAENSDEPAYVIIVVAILAVIICLVALFKLLHKTGGPQLTSGTLAFASVVLGWMTIHTMAAMHYAHRYWKKPANQQAENPPPRGLDFPGKTDPCGYDFMYFAFVIGMTAQTSDVAINTASMRRMNLVHAVLSFFFNTVLIAAAVNAAMTLS
jgi:uncharacterized membrane protein